MSHTASQALSLIVSMRAHTRSVFTVLSLPPPTGCRSSVAKSALSSCRGLLPCHGFLPCQYHLACRGFLPCQYHLACRGFLPGQYHPPEEAFQQITTYLSTYLTHTSFLSYILPTTSFLSYILPGSHKHIYMSVCVYFSTMVFVSVGIRRD